MKDWSYYLVIYILWLSIIYELIKVWVAANMFQ